MSGVYPMRAYSIQAIVPNNLAVGNVTVDLLLLRHDHDVGVTVHRRERDVRVLVAK
jgi:hypothetical protein